MKDFVVSVPDEQAEQFIARFGIEGVKMFGFQLTGEIVHCKDCKHYLELGSIVFDDGSLNRGACSIVRAYVVDITPDGFCSWGERKSEDD